MRTISKFATAAFALTLLGAGCIQFSGSLKNDGGLWRTADRGDKWEQRSPILSLAGGKNANAANVTAIVPDPQDSQTIYVGTAGAGLLYTTDGGDSWYQPKDLANAPIAGVGVDSRNKCLVYAVSGKVVVKTEDCTRTWSKVYEDPREVSLTSLGVDHFNVGTVYLTTSKGDVIKSADGGASWHTIRSWTDVPLIKLVVDPFDSRILYVGTKNKGIWRSADAGATWLDISKGLEQFDGGKDLYDIVPDRSKRDTYVLATRFGLIRTADAGVGWDKIPLVTGPGQVRIYALALNPNNGQDIYYTTATIFYRSNDGGANWTTKRLPTSRAGSALLVHEKDAERIYLGTLLLKK